ncbi:TPA: HIT domain-containing protein [Candidatus Berkelbacteria bacterium]|nr:HIT domain-containing protein [Candidatus Berkelbacteria bacterium]
MDQDKDCIFCKIANPPAGGEEERKLEYSDDEIVAFPSIAPKAKVHLLIVPKRHITSIDELTDEDALIVGKMIIVAKKLAQEKGISGGYKLIFNAGKYQEIKHLHLHLLGGSDLGSIA